MRPPVSTHNPFCLTLGTDATQKPKADAIQRHAPGQAPADFAAVNAHQHIAYNEALGAEADDRVRIYEPSSPVNQVYNFRLEYRYRVTFLQWLFFGAIAKRMMYHIFTSCSIR